MTGAAGWGSPAQWADTGGPADSMEREPCRCASCLTGDLVPANDSCLWITA